MISAPDYTQFVSTRLSEVLADIGVDEKMVLQRRRTYMLMESLYKALFMLRDKNRPIYLFGSQSEGTTTPGLMSDLDRVLVYNEYHVIEDLNDWQPGLRNLLMIQDSSVSDGYCLLQCIRSDAPLPLTRESDHHRFKDSAGRLLLRNAIVSESENVFDKGARHGPAHVIQKEPGYLDSDTVIAFSCTSWPCQAIPWLDKHCVGQWPSADLKRSCSSTGCFVVGVGCRGSKNQELEWRISTSLAERKLMFSLNITQIRCLVLMKMLVKTYINRLFKDVISSYMCKTVLFHCITNTSPKIWRENNLLRCLSLCLLGLYNCVFHANCPHYIIPGNNLMREKISPHVKVYLLYILRFMINSKGAVLLGVKYDDFGKRLYCKFQNISLIKTSEIISGKLLFDLIWSYHSALNEWKIEISTKSNEEAIVTLQRNFVKLISCQCQDLDKIATNHLARWFSSILGCALGSLSIHQQDVVSKDAVALIYLGQKTDATSTKLKLASMLYCAKNFQRAEFAVRGIEGDYDKSIVEPVCSCYVYEKAPRRQGFDSVSHRQNEDAIHSVAASCVQFLPCEIYSAPKELQYEMFRSTEEDKCLKTPEDYWMNWAVVDSLPYLYFLQFKVYSNLGLQEDRRQALSNLALTIEGEPNLGHKETALNLIGQCMEAEGRAHSALQFYVLSLKFREKNNAAKIHICRLLATFINTMTTI